jgi:hypothetical protein
MLRHIASSLDKIPAWFLCVGAPFFAAPIDSMMNLSLSTLVVPSKWKSASILLVAKSYVPLMPSDYQPISFTPVLFRVLEHIVVTDFIHPALRYSHLLSILKIRFLSNQLAQQLQRSSTSFTLSPASSIPIHMLLRTLLTSQKLSTVFDPAHFSSNVPFSPSLITFTIG